MAHGFGSPDWVAAHDGVTLVNVRDRWAYDEGNAPGSMNVPFDDIRDPTDGTPGKLPTADDFGRAFGDAGIGPDDRIVVYDDECGVYASRVLVTATIYVYLEKADEEVFEDIAGSIEAANEQGLTLTEYDATVRSSPEELAAYPSAETGSVVWPRFRPASLRSSAAARVVEP